MRETAPTAPPPRGRSAWPIAMTVAVGLAAAGVAWLATGGYRALAPGRPVSAIAPYVLPLDAGTPADAEIAFYRQRVAATPRGFLERNALAAAYLRKAREAGDPAWHELAAREAATSLALMPLGNHDARLILARIDLAAHRFPEARRLVDEVRRASPRAPVAGLLAQLALAQGEPAEAERIFGGIARDMPSTANLAQLGLARAARGDDAGAEAAFRDAIAREQAGERLASADARTWLGRLRLRRGRLDDAEDLLGEALRIYPAHPQAPGLLADVLARRGDLAAADARWEAFGAARHDVAASLARARIALAAGRAADAEARWREAETRLRKDLAAGVVEHRRDLVRLLLERGVAADAPEAERLAAAELTARRDAETLDLRAAALLALGRAAEADAALAALKATGAREAGYLMREAAVARALGDVARAARLVGEAEALDPTCRRDPAFGLWARKQVLPPRP